METELEETKGVVKKLSDVKNVLNKVITNDNKMSNDMIVQQQQLSNKSKLASPGEERAKNKDDFWN